MRQACGVQTRRERLVAPPSWWIGVLVFAAAWGWVALVVSGVPAAVVTGLLVGGATGGLLWAYGATVVVAGPEGLQVGRAHLPSRHVGHVEPLGPAATRALLGPDADARAWLQVRPYLDTAVRVDVDDPDDPTPYWVVSTRDPEAVAAALRPARPDPDSPLTR